jgi:predicted PurR-regulated permease PerM
VRADQIQARAVAKIVVVALFWTALAVLLAIALLHTRTTLQWVAAAIFLGLALDPAVSLVQRAWPRDGSMPRVLAILIVYVIAFAAMVLLVLHVFPPIVHDIEDLAKKLPGYVRDFESVVTSIQPRRLIRSTPESAAAITTASIEARPSFDQ